MALLAKVWLQHVLLRYTRHLQRGCATNLPIILVPPRFAAVAVAALTLCLLGVASLTSGRAGDGLPSRHLGGDIISGLDSNMTGTSLSTPGSSENAGLATATPDNPSVGSSNVTAIGDGQPLVTIPLSPVSSAASAR